ncbi:MAG: glutaredoxin domain-containing protein [Bacteroidales bacterium]
MEKVVSLADFLNKAKQNDKSFLLLYKSGKEQSNCAYQNLESGVKDQQVIPVYTADVETIKDIHPNYNITSVPTLLIFENTNLTSVIKGCNSSDYYKALTQEAVYYAKAKAEGKSVKRVTVYSTPTCSWCNTLKAWLRKNSILFREIDVSRNQSAAEELVRRSGQQGVPQTDINGQIVVGFDQKRLKELLEIQ